MLCHGVRGALRSSGRTPQQAWQGDTWHAHAMQVCAVNTAAWAPLGQLDKQQPAWRAQLQGRSPITPVSPLCYPVCPACCWWLHTDFPKRITQPL